MAEELLSEQIFRARFEDDMSQPVEKTSSRIKSAFDDLVFSIQDKLIEAKTSVVGFFKGDKGKAALFAGGAIGGLLALFKGRQEPTKTLAEKQREEQSQKSFFRQFLDFFRDNKYVSLVKGFIIGNLFGPGLDVLKSVLKPLFVPMQDFLVNMARAIQPLVDKLFPPMQDFFVNLARAAQPRVMKWANELADWLLALPGKIRSLRQAIQDAGGLMPWLMKKLVEFKDWILELPNKFDAMYTKHESSIKRFTARVREEWDDLCDIIKVKWAVHVKEPMLIFFDYMKERWFDLCDIVKVYWETRVKDPLLVFFSAMMERWELISAFIAEKWETVKAVIAAVRLEMDQFINLLKGAFLLTIAAAAGDVLTWVANTKLLQGAFTALMKGSASLLKILGVGGLLYAVGKISWEIGQFADQLFGISDWLGEKIAWIGQKLGFIDKLQPYEEWSKERAARKSRPQATLTPPNSAVSSTGVGFPPEIAAEASRVPLAGSFGISPTQLEDLRRMLTQVLVSMQHGFTDLASATAGVSSNRITGILLDLD